MPDFLPEFELYVLLAIARCGKDSYGAALRREIDLQTQRPVSVGALYATLARLQEKGFVEHLERTSPLGLRGRPRKYCRLSSTGEAALSHSATMLRRMMDGVSLVEGAES